MKLSQQSALLILLFSYLSVHGINFINITREPVYFSVFYKRGKSVIRQIEIIYDTDPNGVRFVNNQKFDFKDPNWRTITFPWPKQKCVEFTDEELIALGVGVGVGAAALGAAGGAALAGAAGAGAGEAWLGTAMMAPTVASGSTIAGGALLGSSLGSVGAVFSERPCKAEHYPRTVLFSFNRSEIFQKKYDLKSLLSGTIGTSGLYLGDNVDGGETHFLFYNMYGFDPRYAAQGKREGHSAIKGGRINSQPFDDSLIPAILRNYLRFADYYVYGI